MVPSTGIGLEIWDSQFRTWNQSWNRNRIGMFGLRTGIGIVSWTLTVSEPESEPGSRSRHRQSRNRIGIEKI